MEERVATPGRSKPEAARQGLGRTGERLAAEVLLAQGYKILARNFRCPYGEIDLIAQEGEELVFVEVKTRRGDTHGLPEEAVTSKKKQKLIQLANYYLETQNALDCSWRIDVVAVQLSQRGKLLEIRCYKHAVTE